MGFWLGILAALLLAYFTVLNRKYITDADPVTITFIEMTAAWVFLSVAGLVMLPFYELSGYWPDQSDLIYLVILSIGCTVLPFILHLEALKHISAFTTNLVINLEPIYGLILAVIILKEHRELNTGFFELF